MEVLDLDSCGGFGADARAKDSGGANGTSNAARGIGYFSPPPIPGQSIYVLGWCQDGPTGDPNGWLERSFTFG